jgi:hypothetical protein
MDLKSIQTAVKEVAAKNDIPTITYPSTQPATPAPTEVASPESGDGEGKVTPLKPVKVRKKEPAPVRRVSVDLPVYLIKDIAKKSLDDEVTKKFLYLKAFRALGFQINDVDFTEDGRRDNQ